MTKAFAKHQSVQWNWADDVAEGEVQEVYRERVTKTMKGTEVTRNASDEEPAYLIEQEDGDLVLKSHSELQKKSS